MLMRSQINM